LRVATGASCRFRNIEVKRWILSEAGPLIDRRLVSQFLRNAVEIFDAAELSAKGGHQASDLTILIGPGGDVGLVADCDWPLRAPSSQIIPLGVRRE
jgi:hypothetical protein